MRRTGAIAFALVVLWLSGGNARADVRPELRIHYADELLRLQTHFTEVLDELASRDISHLTAAQRLRRTAAIQRLRAYRATGTFPKNTRHRSYRPYFIDDAGTRCAMAHLIEQSGERALVAEIARTANYAYIDDLAREPRLVTWLDANGLSQAEAARIQPAYEPPPCDPECRDDEQCVYTEDGTACSKQCDPSAQNSCGADSQCQGQLSGYACYPPILAEGPRPDSCAIAGGGFGLGFVLLLGAFLLARRRRS